MKISVVEAGKLSNPDIDSFEVSRELFKPPAEARGESHAGALKALDEALNKTSSYIRQLSDNPSKYRPDEEKKISQLWGAASAAINQFDPELANICFVKSQGWLNPKVWNSPQFKSFKLGLDDLRKARMKFNVDYHPEVPPPNSKKNPGPARERQSSKPTVPTWFAPLGAIFLLMTFVVVVWLIVSNDDHSDRANLINILVALGVAGSVFFLGGTIVAHGHIPVPGGPKNTIKFSAQGGVAAFIVVVVLMHWVNPQRTKSPASTVVTAPTEVTALAERKMLQSVRMGGGGATRI